MSQKLESPVMSLLKAYTYMDDNVVTIFKDCFLVVNV